MNRPWKRHAGRVAGTTLQHLRARVLARDGGTCQLRLPGCLVAASQVDHVVALAHGGGNDLDNLRAVCQPCHQQRHPHRGIGARPKGCDPRSGFPQDPLHWWRRVRHVSQRRR